MFYLSRGEQVALGLLLVLLVAGIGVLTYERGVRAALGGSGGPVFVAAPQSVSSPVPPAVERGAPAEPIREPSSEHPTAAGPAPAEAAQPPVDSHARRIISLNSATAQQLDSLPGIGPVYAKRIIDYRERKKRDEGRGFESVDELLNVPGIGPKRLTALRDYVAP